MFGAYDEVNVKNIKETVDLAFKNLVIGTKIYGMKTMKDVANECFSCLFFLLAKLDILIV